MRAVNALVSTLNRRSPALAWRAAQLSYYVAWLKRKWLGHVQFIGVTGSAGKTTTKDLCAAVLSSQGLCHSNKATMNEMYDVWANVLATTRRHRYCVAEVGVSAPDCLDRPLRALQPGIAVVTTIARDHYSAFRSLEAIAREKGKLVAALPLDGIAVLNRDDILVRAMGERHPGRVIWVGRDPGADIRLLECRSAWPEPLMLRVAFEGVEYHVKTRLHGTHLSLIVLCALGVAVAAGIPIAQAIDVLGRQEPTEGRMQIVTAADGVVYLRDDFKAPHWSFDAPMDFMRGVSAARKIAVIGTVSDSPKSPSVRYPAIARRALDVADMAVFVGAQASGAFKAGASVDMTRVRVFPHARDASRFLKAELRRGDFVLLKGTNKSDHLVRLVLDREHAVQCWRMDCRRVNFCTRCSELHAQSPAARLDSVAPAAGSDTVAAGSLLVVGLGNPGPQHTNTPHSLGYRAVDALAQEAGAAWVDGPEGQACSLELQGCAVILFKPATAMNHSGRAVRRFMERRGFEEDACIVVHDDMDLLLSDVRWKEAGGDGGHKGVRSVLAAMGTDRVRRLRMGVRHAGDTRRASDAVLQSFAKADEPMVSQAIDRAVVAVRRFVEERPKRRAGSPVEAVSA